MEKLKNMQKFLTNGYEAQYSVAWTAKCIGGSPADVCDKGGIKGKTTVKTDKMGRSTMYVQPTYWSNEATSEAFNNFSIAFEGEKGTEIAGLMTTQKKAWGYGSTSPCMINEVWSKCGKEYMDVVKPMGAKVQAMEKIANSLKTEDEKKAFWKKIKADPKTIAEWKEMEQKSKALFKDDKKTWETAMVDASKKGSDKAWVTFMSMRKFRTSSEVSRSWKRNDNRKFSLAWSNKKGESMSTISMELMMSDNAMALAASATMVLSAITLM